MTNPLIAAVKAYALKNYEKDGWDYVIECWEDHDILDAIGSAKTEEEAIKKVHRAVKSMDEYRKDIQGA